MKATTFLLACALTGGASAETIPAENGWPELKEVIVVCKTHFDLGYTHRIKDLIPHYRTRMIDQAMDIMDQCKDLPPDQQFAWTAPGWVMAKVLEDWPGQSPERKRRLDTYLADGKFRIHALPFTLESDACEPEEMARGFSFSSKLARDHGMPLPISGKMTDVPSHGSALATVLSRGGVKFMHIGCNWPSGYVRTPGLFWWEGPDGSRVLTLYSSYYSSCTALMPADWRSPVNFSKEPMIGDKLLPPKGWPHRVWPAIIVTPDNSGPPRADQVKALFADAAARLPGVRFRMGTMDDFANAVLSENPNLPVVKAEMPDTWIHGIMSDPGGTRISREIHPLVASAEALNTLLLAWGCKVPAVGGEVAGAYENILLYGEHTWGMAPAVDGYGEAFKQTNPNLIANLEGSWEDKTDYIRHAEATVRKIAADNLGTLAQQVSAPKGSWIVCNPLPWPRSGIVELNGVRRFAKDVPASGYLTLPPLAKPESAPAATGPVIENRFYQIKLDPAKATIVSLVDKKTGREWIDVAAARGLGQYLNERFTYEQTLDYTVTYQAGRAFGSFGAKGEWPHPGMHKTGMVSSAKVPYRAATSRNAKLTQLRDATGQTATLDCPADPANHLPASSLRITMPDELPYIDLEITLRNKAKDNWPEADWLCLPFRIDHPVFKVHRQLGVMDPATGILPGANRDLYSVGNGVTLADASGSGVAVCPIDHPLVSLGRPGIWKFSTDYQPKDPIIYLNLYNNQWNTNFRYWYPGTWGSRVRLTFFDSGSPAEQALASMALAARNSLTAVAAVGGGALPASREGIRVSREGVAITAFGSNPDGNGTLLRLWKMAGGSGELTVTLPPGFSTATPVNLRGESTGAPIEVKEDRFTTPLGRFAPASFVLN